MKTFSPKPLLYISALLVVVSGIVFINTSTNFLFPNGYIQDQKAQVGDAFQNAVNLAKNAGVTEELGQFITTGTPGRAGLSVVGPGKISGKEYVYKFFGYYGGSSDMLVIDPDDGSYEKVSISESGIMGATVGSDNNLYIATGPGGKVLKYVTTSGVLQDLGKPVSTESVIYSFGGYEKNKDHIYAGTALNAHLIDIDVVNQQISDLGRIDPSASHAQTPILYEKHNSVYVVAGSQQLKFIRYDLADKTFSSLNLPAELSGLSGLSPDLYKSNQGNICLKYNNRGYYIFDKDTVKEAVPISSYCSWSYQYSYPWSVFSDGSYIKASTNLYGISFIISTITNGQIVDRTVNVVGYEGSKSDAFAIGKGSDGNIYVSGALPASVWKYDKNSNTFSLLGLAHSNIGQFYNFIPLGSATYFIGYPKSRILKYDPNTPFYSNLDNYNDPASNPKEVANSLPTQSRPVATIALSDGRLAIGSIPAYGTYGGAISIYDPNSNNIQVNQNVYLNHSIYSLVEMPGNILVAGSSKEGGTGVATPEGDSGIVFFNTSNQNVIGSIITIPNAVQISALVKLNDDEFLGVANLSGSKTQFFTGSISSKTITKTGPVVAYNYRLIYGALALGRDGYVYGLSQGGIIIVDPLTLVPDFIEKRSIRAGFVYDDGMIYFSDWYSGKLFRRRVLNENSSTPSPTPASCLPAGQSGSPTLNSCAVGTFSDVTDTSNQSIWMCLGLNGGSNTTCSSPKDPNLSPTPTPTPILRASDGICGNTLNSCTQGILRNTEDSTTQYLWMCLGSNNGFDASCSQTRYIPPVTTNPPTNPVNQPRTPSSYKPQPTIYKTGTTPNKDTYTINIPTSTIDITLPKPPSWLDVIKTLLNKIITNIIRGIKRTGEVIGI